MDRCSSFTRRQTSTQTLICKPQGSPNISTASARQSADLSAETRYSSLEVLAACGKSPRYYSTLLFRMRCSGQEISQRTCPRPRQPLVLALVLLRLTLRTKQILTTEGSSLSATR